VSLVPGRDEVDEDEEITYPTIMMINPEILELSSDAEL
jgi:hypothetical protein